MLERIFWHGTGVFGLIAGVLLLRIIIKIFRKEKKHVVVYTICLGIVTGVLGVICGVLMLVWLDTTAIAIEPGPGINFAVRTGLGTIFFYFGAFLVGAIAGKLLHKICPADAIVFVALMVATFFVVHPIVYRWYLLASGSA